MTKPRVVKLVLFGEQLAVDRRHGSATGRISEASMAALPRAVFNMMSCGMSVRVWGQLNVRFFDSIDCPSPAAVGSGGFRFLRKS